MKTNNKAFTPKQIALLGLLIGILLLMSFTPLGYLNIGLLAITFNMIPVAVAAVALGPKGGAIAGAVFGITSFLQCMGIGGTSYMGMILFEISPILAFIQRFVPRLITGIAVGFIYKGVKKLLNHSVASFVAGFFAAFLNTALFMGALVLLFGNTEYVQNLMGGQDVLLFICGFVGINAVFEIISSTVITGILCTALGKARLLQR